MGWQKFALHAKKCEPQRNKQCLNGDNKPQRKNTYNAMKGLQQYTPKANIPLSTKQNANAGLLECN
jgi:hypothetical protein